MSTFEINKNMTQKLSINDLPKQIPDYKNSELPKDKLTEQWLTEWILSAYRTRKIKAGDILPQKNKIAEYLGISIGTVQNAIRYTEDKGFLKSKQKKGTMIATLTGTTDVIKKQTSKRDAVVIKIKKYIAQSGVNATLPSTAEAAKKINVSVNTIRAAYMHLCNSGILEYTTFSGKKQLRVKKIPMLTVERTVDTSVTLVEKTTVELSSFIEKNLKRGEKLQTRQQLAQILNVSLKTVHDAVRILESKGILLSRRGRYGTVVVKIPGEENTYSPQSERSIFAKAEDAAFYRWQKIENQLTAMIKKEYEPGMKLPSMDALSKKFDVSTNTIRKALKTLSDEGFIDFERGRCGGTFVTDIPEDVTKPGYKWLAVTPGFIPVSAGN